jgi:hypothetical protein
VCDKNKNEDVIKVLKRFIWTHTYMYVKVGVGGREFEAKKGTRLWCHFLLMNDPLPLSEQNVEKLFFVFAKYSYERRSTAKAADSKTDVVFPYLHTYLCTYLHVYMYQIST